MKKVALIVGIILSSVGFFQVIGNLDKYNTLTQFGKGYVWGSLTLLVIGSVFVYLGLKNKPIRR